MEVLRTSNSNNYQNHSNANLSSSKSVLYRLASFQSSETILHQTLTKGTLAQFGFRKISADKIQCEGCQFGTHISTSANDLVNEHMIKSPHCYFTQQHSNILVTNSSKL